MNIPYFFNGWIDHRDAFYAVLRRIIVTKSKEKTVVNYVHTPAGILVGN